MAFYRFVTRNFLAKRFSSRMISFVMATNIIMLAFICVKEAGNSLFFGNCAKIRHKYSLSRYLNNSQDHRIPFFTDI